MFRATLCPSSGADDLVVFFHVWCSASSYATHFPMDTQPANRIWLPTQPRHYTTREKIPLSRQLLKMGTRWPETCWATYQEQLIRRNKYNTKWHLVGFLFHTELRCTVNHTSNWIQIRIYTIWGIQFSAQSSLEQLLNTYNLSNIHNWKGSYYYHACSCQNTRKCFTYNSHACVWRSYKISYV